MSKNDRLNGTPDEDSLGNTHLDEMFGGVDGDDQDISDSGSDDDTNQDTSSTDDDTDKDTSNEGSDNDRDQQADDGDGDGGDDEELTDIEKMQVKLDEQQAYITQMQQDRSQMLRDQLTNQFVQPRPQPHSVSQPGNNGGQFAYDPEKMLENPADYGNALTQHIASQVTENLSAQLAEQMDAMAVQSFVSQTPDINEHTDAMQALFKQNPGVQNMSKGDALRWLYKVAKSDAALAARPAEKKVAPADGSGNKNRAASDGGASGKKRAGKTSKGVPSTQAGWNNKTEAEMEKIIGYDNG